MLKVLFLEKNISKASPLHTYANAIQTLGIKVNFADFSALSTFELIKLYIKADCIVLQHYSTLTNYEKRQLILAPALGTPIVRNWAGTDVLNALVREEVKDCALWLEQFVTYNITDNHSGLVIELKSIGIECGLTPKIFNLDSKFEFNVQPLNKRVLVYLPTNSQKFYGAEYIEFLAKKYSDIKFVIIADNNHSFKGLPNIESKGWINKNEMEKVWQSTGLLIRITEHDGIPRMAYEALARGVYVIHNNKNLKEFWFANDKASLVIKFEKFLEMKEMNNSGIKFIKNHLSSKPEENLIAHLKSVNMKFLTRIAALKELILNKY